MKKEKWLSKEALKIAEKRKEAKGKGQKERYTHLKVEFQRVRHDLEIEQQQHGLISGFL